ncbi:glycosyltransferase family 2 protein [Castellaniella hirudinis]|uniref:Glycosyltransferase family 2 protein n=1 Tax=Castellaniella hirudinis TaxID=1144617 RepID=A0ABV8RYJ6_9BURK
MRVHELYDKSPDNAVVLNRIGLFRTSLETSPSIWSEFRLARLRAHLEFHGPQTLIDPGRYIARVSDVERRLYALTLARWNPRGAAQWLTPGEWGLKAALALAEDDPGRGFDIVRAHAREFRKSKDLRAILAALHCRAGEFSQARKLLNSLLMNDSNSIIDADTPLRLADFIAKPEAPNTASGRNAPRISVIICAYNAAPYVETALRSVLNQTYPNIEIISIDDGSQDHTFQHMRRLASENPRIVALQFPNNGTYAARNIGIRYASGDFITFLDADDIMLPQRIASQWQALTLSGATATVSRLIRISEDGILVAPRIFPLSRHNPCSLMMQRSVLRDVGVFDETRFGADEEYEHRIALRLGGNALLRTPDVQTLALHRTGSLTQAPQSGLASAEGRQARIAYRESWVRRHLREAAGDR